MKTICLIIFLFFPLIGQSQTKNGFDLFDALIPSQKVLQGGPPRDGIPSIDKPKFLSAKNADFLKSKDRILGIAVKGKARAYPIKVLNWHEIVNDQIGNTPFVITYCPLCGSGVAFSSLVAGNKLTFGVSGLLYNSDVLLYDRNTGSLWSQIWGKGVSGKHKTVKLKMLPMAHTTWGVWKKQHPDSLVLSRQTGFARNYNENPYAGYEKARELFFSVDVRAPEKYHPKERVLGIEFGKTRKAYPFIELNKTGQSTIKDTVGNYDITIQWNQESQSGKVLDDKGKEIPIIQLFWFAWYTFYPNTQVFQSPNRLSSP